LDISGLILGAGLIAVSALNSAALVYLVHQKSGAKKEDSPKEEVTDEAEDQTVPSTGRPTTKAGILTWRQRIIEDLERERGTKVITMIHKKELWTEPGEDPEIGIEENPTGQTN
jgi:hypothetical protein